MHECLTIIGKMCFYLMSCYYFNLNIIIGKNKCCYRGKKLFGSLEIDIMRLKRNTFLELLYSMIRFQNFLDATYLFFNIVVCIQNYSNYLQTKIMQTI